jgi:hypothetical protein
MPFTFETLVLLFGISISSETDIPNPLLPDARRRSRIDLPTLYVLSDNDANSLPETSPKLSIIQQNKRKLNIYCATMALSDNALSTRLRHGCACCLLPREAGASLEASQSSQRAWGRA